MVYFIACCKSKLKKRSKASDLYQGLLFKKSLAYAMQNAKKSDIYILSALYGILELHEEIDPYDLTLINMSKEDRLRWADKVKQQADLKGIDLGNAIYLAGENYIRPIESLIGHKLKDPMKGLGIGKRMKFLNDKLECNLF